MFFKPAIFEKTTQLKQLLGIGLCISLLAPFVGTWSWLHFEKKRIRTEVNERILGAEFDKSDLVFLTFTRLEAKSELIWHHSGEFEYLGRKYDVVESEIKENQITYWCWADHAETQVDLQLDRLTKNHNSEDRQKQESQKRLVDFLRTLCFSYPDGKQPFSQILPMIPDCRCRILRSQTGNAPPTPPPEIV